MTIVSLINMCFEVMILTRVITDEAPIHSKQSVQFVKFSVMRSIVSELMNSVHECLPQEERVISYPV
jgi:hypothetical protein